MTKCIVPRNSTSTAIMAAGDCGQGIRYNADGEKAYNMSGTFGIKLNIKQQTIIIGTKQPNIFIRSIQMAQQNKMNRSIQE